MGILLENAKSNREKERIQKTTGYSYNKGLLANTRLKKQLNKFNEMYNDSQRDIAGTSMNKYSNQSGYRNRMNNAQMVSHMGDITKRYVSTMDNSINKASVNDYINDIQNNIKAQNTYRENLGKYMTQFEDENDFNNYKTYSGKSQAELDARINELDSLISDIASSDRDNAIKERDWLHEYYNSHTDYLKNTDTKTLNNQILELEEQIENYRKRMDDASALSGIQAMTSDPQEYSESLKNRKLSEDYKLMMESAYKQKELLQERYNQASAYQSYLEATAQYEELKAQGYTPSDSYGEALLYSAGSGAWDAGVNSIAAFTDATLGKPLRALENTKFAKYLGMDLPGEQIGDLYKLTKQQSEINKNYRLMDDYTYNKGMEQKGMNLSSAVGSALPLVLTGVLTGGGSAAASSKTIVGVLKNLAKNPQYWASFVTIGGNTYDSAIDEGATYEEALAAGLINASIGAATETGGGFEKAVSSRSNTFSTWLKSALEEGGEEVVQGMIENTTKKAVYDHDRAIYSSSDENAIINPQRMAGEFGYGALAGGILSGAGVVSNAAFNTYTANIDYMNTGKEIINQGTDAINEVVEESEMFGTATKVYKLGQTIKKQLQENNVDDVTLGKLYSAIGISRQTEVIEYTKAALRDVGISEDEADEYIVIAKKMLAGGELTVDEINSVRENKEVSNVFNEIIGDVPTLEETVTASQNDEIRDFSANMQNSSYNLQNVTNESNFIDGVSKITDEDIAIQRFETTGDKLSMVTTSGEKLNIKDVVLTDEMRVVASFANKYPVKTANSLLQSYKLYNDMNNGEASTLMFSRSWNQMYKYGLSGTVTFDNAMEYVIKDIPKGIYEIAYSRGQQDHKAEVEAKQQEIDTKRKNSKKRQGKVASIDETDAKQYKVSAVDMDNLSNKQKDAVAVMEVISKALGVNTYFFNDAGNGKIHGIYRNGNIYLNVNAGHYHEQAVLRTAAHELTHHIQNVSPKLYEELKTFIISKYYESSSDTFNSLVNEKMESLNLPTSKAIDEVVADACEMMLKDGSAVTALVDEHRTLWEKIKDFVTNIVKKIKNAMKGIKESSPAAVELKNVLGEWTELQKMWNRALVESSVYEKTTGNEKFSLNELKGSDITKNKVIETAVDEVINMESVKVLNGNEFAKGDKKLSEQLMDYFLELGNKVNHPDIGEIILDIKGIKSSLGHGIGRKKSIAYRALPEVLEKGKIIYFSDNWKQRRYQTCAVAAPFNIETEQYYMVVIVSNETKKDRYYTHDVAYIKIDDTLFKTWSEDSKNPAFSGNVPSTYSLLYELIKVKSMQDTEDALYSSEGDKFSPRYILATTLLDTVTNTEEYANLKKYQEHIKAIEDKETRLAITRNAIKTAIFEREAGMETSKVNLAKLKKAAKTLENSIDWWDKKLLQLEATTPLKNLMERQKKKLSEKYMSQAKTRLDESRARFYASNRREQIKKNANTLISWLNKPDNNHYVPDVLKEPVLEFLTSIDFISSKASPDSNTSKDWTGKMNRLKHMLTEAELDGMSGDDKAISFMDAVDPDLKHNIRDFIKNNKDSAKLSDLSPAEVENLHRIIVSLKSAVTNANKFYANRMSANIETVGKKTMNALLRYKDKNNNKITEVPDSLLNIDMLDSYSYFNMMGEGGLSIYNELREGFDKRIHSLKEAQDYMSENLLADKTESERNKLMQEWSGSRAKIHTFTYKNYLGQENEVSLTTGQLMNLYCLSKREQAMGHITVGGVRIKPAANTKVKGNVRGVHVSGKQLETWFEKLTDTEKQTAEMMQEYLSTTVSGWGNEVSQAMYGYNKFQEKNYWPIDTDSNTNRTSDRTAGGISFYQLKNLGMTKAVTPNANNPLMVGDIFDVFTKHIGDMANYRGFVIPLSDAMKWFNYGNNFEFDVDKEKMSEFDSVKLQIERALGVKAKQYFVRLMQDINGGDTLDKSISEKFVSNYKAAAVGANLRVTIQQPMSYFRAAAVIDPKYLVKALKNRPAIKEMQEYSGVAQWKAWGYFDTGIGQSLKTIITGQESIMDNIRDKSMWLTGKADDVTWGTLWNACKEEIKDIHPDIVNTEEFMKLVTKRFDEVIDRTQVVDTVLHRTQIMRSKNAFNQMATSFMSEPSKSFNMLRNAIVEAKISGSKEAKLNAARTISVWLISSFATAAAASVVDAFRGSDDEDKKWGERWLEALKDNAIDNVNPLNMIPYVKEIPSFIEGYTSERMDMAALSNSVKFVQSIVKVAQGKETNKNAYYYVRQFARVGSQLTGVSFYNAMRDFEGLWNSIKVTPKITTKKETASSLGKNVAEEYMSGNTQKAKISLKEVEKEIAKEYPAYDSDKVHSVAVSKVKSSITSEYKEAYISGSNSEKKEIISAMYSSGLYEDYEDAKSTCQSWEVSYWKDAYIKARTHAERTEYRKKLYDTGKWRTLSDLDSDIKKWISGK